MQFPPQTPLRAVFRPPKALSIEPTPGYETSLWPYGAPFIMKHQDGKESDVARGLRQQGCSRRRVISHLRCALGALGILVVVATARGDSPLVRFGQSGAVFFSLQSSLRLDDNIYLRANDEEGDTVGVLTPGASIEFGEPEVINGHFAVHESVLRYFDNEAENDELLSADAGLRWPGARGDLEFSASFEQLRENTREYRAFGLDNQLINALARRDQSSLRLRGEYEISAKTSLAGGLSYHDEDFKFSYFRDRRDTSIPLNGYYELTPKIDLSLGYVHRREQLSGAGNYRYRDHFLNLGARGEFTPKLQGYVQVGVTDRRGAGVAKQSTLGLDGSLSWAATPKSSYEISFSRGFSAAGAAGGESWADTRAGLVARYGFSDAWTVQAELRYQHAGYFGGRRDDFVSGAMTGSWSPKEFIVLSATLAVQSNASDSTSADFDFDFNRSLLSVAAALRY